MSALIETTVSNVVGRVAQSAAPVDLQTPFAALDLNSAKVMQVIVALESELDFELEDEDLVMSNFLSGRHIVDLLTNRYGRLVAAE